MKASNQMTTDIPQEYQDALSVLEAQGRITQDGQGLPRLRSGPVLNRRSMTPEPWQTNILVRLWRRLKGQRNKPIERQVLPRASWRKVGERRRLVLLILIITQTIFATQAMRGVLPYHGDNLLEIAILALFALLFAWVSAGFWTALMGFFQLLKGHDKYCITATVPENTPITSGSKTAIVMPICNEDIPRVFAGLRATIESVKRAGQLEHFDFFILSDTFNPDLCVQEQQAWFALCQELDGFDKIFYRRRRRRVKRKSGNIDDFCRRWGANYEYMVVLDADSVMTGECLKRLVVLMDGNPDAGIIQTAPKASGMDSLYARIQQFATRVYGPLFTAGLHYWQLGESHYWGHNAIIRVKPFMEHCALAPLPGKGAFAGAILSHDFVEAALMRRAGWGVWIAYDLEGSFEELPPNLLEELQRDQRWCHGNLMNFRLFLIKGLHPVHRAVFLTGVMSYLSAPLWFLFLCLSTAMLAVHTLVEPVYFREAYQMMPIWPEWNPDKALILFSTTAILLFLPKVLSVVLLFVQGSREYGGPLRLAISMLIEVIFSMLLAPIRMIFHTRFVVAAFLGWGVGWKSPARDNNQTPWSESIRRHGSQTLLGFAWGGLVAWLNPNFLWWMLPILLSFTLIIPVSVFSSWVSLGKGLYERRILRIPEESFIPLELRATKRYTEKFNQQFSFSFSSLWTSSWVYTLARYLAMARPRFLAPSTPQRQRLIDDAKRLGVNQLPNEDKLKLLDDVHALTAVHTQQHQG